MRIWCCMQPAATGMSSMRRGSAWLKGFERSVIAMTRMASASGTQAFAKSLKPLVAKRTPPPGAGA